jgi:peroxisomal enoyl-CoA hydratase 2
MTFYRELPSTSTGRRFTLHAKVAGVYDKGKLGSVVEIEQMLVDDESGEKYAKIVGNTFYMGQGNWGGPKGQSVLVLLISTTISPLQGQLD